MEALPETIEQKQFSRFAYWKKSILSNYQKYTNIDNSDLSSLTDFLTKEFELYISLPAMFQFAEKDDEKNPFLQANFALTIQKFPRVGQQFLICLLNTIPFKLVELTQEFYTVFDEKKKEHDKKEEEIENKRRERGKKNMEALIAPGPVRQLHLACLKRNIATGNIFGGKSFSQISSKIPKQYQEELRKNTPSTQ